MVLQDLFDKIYNKLYVDKHIKNVFFRLARVLCRAGANVIVPVYFKVSKYSSKERSDVVVSLTSYPARMSKIWIVIESLKRQTTSPSKIILWLARNQFPGGVNDIPTNLVAQIDNIFEIRFVEDDFKSHKKYFYAFQCFKNQLVFLADDDFIYPSWIIKNSLDLFKQSGSEKCVVGHWGYKMNYDSNNKLMPYDTWTQEFNPYDNKLFFGTGGGSLIRPADIYKDCCDEKLFMDLATTVDDVWINTMCHLSGLRIVINLNYCIPLSISGDTPLVSRNRGENINDKAILTIRNHYKESINVDPFDL